MFREWFSTVVAGGGMSVFILCLAIGVAIWALAKTYEQTRGSGQGGNGGAPKAHMPGQSVGGHVPGPTPGLGTLLVQIPTSQTTADATDVTWEAWESEASKEGENGVTPANILSNQLVHQTSRRLNLNLSPTETTVQSSLKTTLASSQPKTKILLTCHTTRTQRRFNLPRD